MKAFILLRVEMGHLEDVSAAVRKMSGVISADPTFGEYDVIVEVNIQTMHELGILVGRDIQCTPGVQQTHTCIAFN